MSKATKEPAIQQSMSALEAYHKWEIEVEETKKKMKDAVTAEALPEIVKAVKILTDYAESARETVISELKKAGFGGGRSMKGEGEKGTRITKIRMEELILKVKSELKKGKEYSVKELAEALGCTADECRSVLSRTKRDGILKSNGVKGSGGRSSLA